MNLKKLVVALAFLSLPLACFAMTSTNYQIVWDSVNVGGTDTSTSTNFSLRDTIGEGGTGFSSSTNFQIQAGYRSGDAGTSFLTIQIGTQENGTRTVWSAFSNGGRTVTVASAAAFSVGDYIAVVENIGFGERVAIGKISNIAGTVVTVDAWDGESALLSASPSGGDDFVYRMSGKQAQLGVQTIATESTSVTLTDVASNASNGYTVTIQGETELQSGSATIASVSDGAVTAGSEEYGVEAVGTRAVGAGSDVSIPVATTRTIQQSSGSATGDRIGVIYKLAVSGSTPSGNYSQTVIYRLTGNF